MCLFVRYIFSYMFIFFCIFGMREDSKNKIKGFRFLQSSMSSFMRFLQVVVVYWKGAGGPESRREYFIHKLFNSLNNWWYNYECFLVDAVQKLSIKRCGTELTNTITRLRISSEPIYLVRMTFIWVVKATNNQQPWTYQLITCNYYNINWLQCKTKMYYTYPFTDHRRQKILSCPTVIYSFIYIFFAISMPIIEFYNTFINVLVI